MKRHQFCRTSAWMEEHARKHFAYRMKLVAKGRDHAEVGPRAAHGPEEIRVLLGTGGQQLAVRGDHIQREQIVTCRSVFPHEVTKPAAQGQPGDAGVRYL